MTVHIGTDTGVCKACQKHKTDLYRDYCTQCRIEFGKRGNHDDWKRQKEAEKVEYQQKLKAGEVNPITPSKSADEKAKLDYMIGYIYIRRAVEDMLASLAKCGYSREDITAHWKANGDLFEPYKSIDRLIRLMENQPQ